MDAQDPIETLRRGDVLIVVDVQPDFMPGGALPVAGGYAVVEVLNRWLEVAAERELDVYASRDWHPAHHGSFHTHGGTWPPHCVQDTPGAAYHPELKLPPHTIKIAKGTRLDRDQHSAFDGTGLAEHLRQRRAERLWIGGLALDVCVRATVLDALREGFETHVILDATRPVDPAAGRRAVREMRAAGAYVHEHTRPYDPVAEAGFESFPASDPPSFTPQKL